jgi:hypothetical protein
MDEFPEKPMAVDGVQIEITNGAETVIWTKEEEKKYDVSFQFWSICANWVLDLFKKSTLG